MGLKIVAWDEIYHRFRRTDKDPSDIQPAPILDIIDSGSVNLNQGATSKTITYNSVFGSADSYALVINFSNQIDDVLQFQPILITSKTTNGFNAVWNAPLDSSNYYLDYIVVTPVSLFRANVENLSSNVNMYTASLLSANAQAIIPQIVNEVDPDPLILLPVTMTDIDTIQFTTNWNIKTNSNNYNLHWMATSISASMAKSNVYTLSQGITSATVNFGFPALSSSNFAVIPRMSNVVDNSAHFQPVTITEKTNTKFTAKWNVPTDSGNYRLHWILRIY